MENRNKKEISLVENIQQQILDYVTKDGYRANMALPKENELSELLGVSRVVVREALSSLRALGFLETKKKKGSVMVSPEPFDLFKMIIRSGTLSENTVSDLYELRLMLEVGLADFLFDRKTDEDMLQLMRIIEEEESCEDAYKLTELDIEFHSKLYNIANSSALSSFQSLLGKIFTIYPYKGKKERLPEIITHRSLYHILETGNPDSFRSAMRLHLTYQFENKEKYLNEYYNKMLR
ncbi:FadR/GntR family transcriptional regulator [Parabacteroides sp. Marseille-P3160]|uniref:FadR/GntR family transcriptional regulator n=1 Tax=Parabacteroides sp. Marseille-P3160 TaxID=1917887 RepID=UPI0009BA109E|nr:FCD domain-containing protein [Parabacteroides sp. Marseille-P3160]